jgi:hypothetical protein
MTEGFNLVYAKIGNAPKNIFLEKRIDIMKFLANNLNNINFLSINDVIIDNNKLVNDNIKLGRYLKLMIINEI